MDWLCNTSGSFLSFVPCLLLVLYINLGSSWVLPSWNSLEYIEFASYPSSHLLVPIPDVQRPLVLPWFLTELASMTLIRALPENYNLFVSLPLAQKMIWTRYLSK